MQGLMIQAAWRAAATLLAPALRLNLRRRAANGREIIERLPERFGIDPAPRPPGRLIWMHAASVGETISVLPVLEALRTQTTVLLTTGTTTSQVLLAHRLRELGLSNVLHRFAPLDVPSWIEKFLTHWQPDAGCFVESELWPNQLAACRRRRIKLMLLNARVSDRSFAYWRQVPGFARLMLSSFAHVQPRSDQDAVRLRALGAACVGKSGDLKFAAPPLPVAWVELERLKKLLAGRPVWLAASTHPGEEAVIAKVHRAVAARHLGLVTIIVPRHPDRGEPLAAELGALRRAAGDDPPPGGGIWIADTLGELGLFYRLATIAFVGRSLIAPGGGQNPLEPARLGCAIAVGPHTANFIDHVGLLRETAGLVEVADQAALTGFVTMMLDSPDRRLRLAEAATAAVRRFSDLPQRSADKLLSLLPGC